MTWIPCSCQIQTSSNTSLGPKITFNRKCEHQVVDTQDVVAIDSDALGPFAPGEDFVIGNISTMVDQVMGGR